MARAALTIPRDRDNAILDVDGREVRLTNLRKVFWAGLGLTKGDLLRYYADVADVLLPHIRDRAMVMKRYPHGAAGDFFFMKRAPSPRPDWIRTCAIDHGEEKTIDFPVIDDRASLMWVINLGCIDLNQWYARCDDVGSPDYVHFDLDPGVGATFDAVREAGLIVREALDTLKMPSLVKTTGSKGLHVYVPIVRGPEQKDVWTFAKALAQELAVAQSGAHHRGVPRREAAEGARARRLQPECLGPDPGLDLFRAPAAGGDRVHAGHLEGSRAGRPHRGLHDDERAGAREEGRRPVEAAERVRGRVDLGRYL